MGIFVGIDLGTTQTAVCAGTIAAVGALQWRRIPLHQPIHDTKINSDYDTLPSVVWINGRSILTGRYPEHSARQLTVSHPDSRLIRSIKREMGNAAWSVEADGITYRPYHIAGTLLATVHRSIARAYPDQPIERVVITTPASFSSAMRRETLRAARLAGFAPDRVALLDEPVAAFLSLFAEAPPAGLPDPATLLVFDMGGGTLDVSVIEYRASQGSLDLLSTSRYNEVAGDDLDLEIAALLLREIRKAGGAEFNSSTVPGLGLGLLALGEQTKLALSDLLEAKGPRRGGFNYKIKFHDGQKTTIEVTLNEQFPGIEPAAVRVAVADVARAIAPFFDEDETGETSRTIFVPIDQALNPIGKTYDQIDRVYLTGGSSRFGPVQDALRDRFHEFAQLHPFHAVAQGALVWAANAHTQAIHLRERLFDNLYLQRVGNKFFEVLHAPVPVPAGGEKRVWTSVALPTGSDAIRLPDSRRVRLDFFRGTSPHDPFMTAAHSELRDLPRGVKEGAMLTRLEAAVDADKVFHCRFYFEVTEKGGSSKEIPEEVDFWPIDESAPVDDRYGEGLTLNGERLGSS